MPSASTRGRQAARGRTSITRGGRGRGAGRGGRGATTGVAGAASSSSSGPRGRGCDVVGHRAMVAVATTCLPMGEQLAAANLTATGLVGSCACLRPAEAPPPRCVLQTTYRRRDGLGAQMYMRQAHLLEAAQLGCTFADAPLDLMDSRSGTLAHDAPGHSSRASEVLGFFNMGSATPGGACPNDAPRKPPHPHRGCGGLKGQERDRDDPSAVARLRRAAAAGVWCAAEYPPMAYMSLLFDTTAWLRARATMRSRYLSAVAGAARSDGGGDGGGGGAQGGQGGLGPELELSRAKHASPWFHGPPEARHRLRQLHIAAHIRRGDVSGPSHFRYVAAHVWAEALASVARAALQVAGPRLSLHFLVLSEDGWDAASAANVSAALAAVNATAAAHGGGGGGGGGGNGGNGGNGGGGGGGGGRVFYSQRVGGHPLHAFAHLVQADVLAVSDSHFSIAAAQLSLGVQLRIRRRGFGAVDLQHMLPLPLPLRDGRRAPGTRNRGCAEDEEALVARSRATFSCRLRGYLAWRGGLARQRNAERAAAARLARAAEPQTEAEAAPPRYCAL